MPIPNYKKAMTECYRCLKPNGIILFSIPFAFTKENIIRAHLSNEREVVHLLPPEYHGDPISSNGVLCFYQFGWELLEELNTIGFKNVKALLYWSENYGYLGDLQIIFTAQKSSDNQVALWQLFRSFLAGFCKKR